MRAPFIWLCILPIRAYRLILSPLLDHSCRFQPSCPAYVIGALLTHGPVRSLWLTLRRLARCTPWGGSGYDLVPPVARRKTS
ncbi:MAG: membrane protein insertion efficiency factor YidD [Pseudomonadota bacterium]